MFRFFGFLPLAIVVSSAFADPLEVHIDHEQKIIRAENSYFHTVISFDDQIRIQQFTTEDHDYLWPNSEQSKIDQSIAGHRLFLYMDHPVSSTSTLTASTFSNP